MTGTDELIDRARRLRAERAQAEDRLRETDADGRHAWEPRYGFTSRDRVLLAAAVEAVRRRICIYRHDPCDCKYGIGIEILGVKPGGEASGCPELRSVVLELLHPEPAAADHQLTPHAQQEIAALLRIAADPQQSPAHRAVALLTAHQRWDVGSCLCGWNKLGSAHAGHLAEELGRAGLLATADHRARAAEEPPGLIAPNGCDDCSVEPGEPHRYTGCPGNLRHIARDAEQNREMRQSMNADGEL